jgi:hypothetical protein
MIDGEWKRAEGDRQSPRLVRFRLYRTIALPLASYRESYGEFLIEGPLLARLLPMSFLRLPNLPLSIPNLR